MKIKRMKPLQRLGFDMRALALKFPALRPWHLATGLLSLRYLFLRSSTSAAAVVSGLVQTFVFARVLSPQQFSIFILIAAIGSTFWLIDFGAGKILFVRQRERHLAQHDGREVPAQSTAIIVLYFLLVATGALLCFLVMASRPTVTAWQAVEFALFFSFAALNLVWFPLRNVSLAIDDYIFFEALEAIRRVGHIALISAMLIGLPLPVFLVLANLLWAVLLIASAGNLVRQRALVSRLAGWWRELMRFYRGNRAELVRSGTYAAGEQFVYSFPYFVVPVLFGLGAPTIILDTTFKIFRGATFIYAAGLDPLVPRQTRAFAEGDAPTLIRATLTATVLCAVPTVILCALLIFVGDRIFMFLLGHAATVPPQVSFILVVLLIANMAQNIASCLLLHTGFFKPIARIATFLVISMCAMTAIAALAKVDIVGFIAAYTATYLCGSALYVLFALRGPIRLVHRQPAASEARASLEA